MTAVLINKPNTYLAACTFVSNGRDSSFIHFEVNSHNILTYNNKLTIKIILSHFISPANRDRISCQIFFV